MKYIHTFAEEACERLELAGGKGANLSKMWRAGFPVPAGFCVTTRAYEAFIDARGLRERISRLEAEALPDDVEALEIASRHIRALFLPDGLFGPGEPLAPFTGELALSLESLARESGGCPLAVRSSATAEDLPDFSFAGQQDTYLNMYGLEQVLQAVVKCWSSLWTARAMGYRARSGLRGSEIALAVVVQQMVESESSGVMFTANPVTGRRGEVVIDASFGLGEALVSGIVEPDHYVVDASGARILSRQLGAKAVSIRGRVEGGVERRAEQAAAEQALSDERILELARLGRQMEAYFRSPQDIEWAWAGGRLHLLQSRPITSLFPLAERLSPDGPLHVLFSLASVQGLMDPITPLGRDNLQVLAAGIASLFGQKARYDTQLTFYTAAERMFIDLTGVARHPRARNIWRSAVGGIDPVVQGLLGGVLEDPRLAPRYEKMRLSTRLKVARAAFTLAGNVLLNLLFPAARRDRLNRKIEATVTQMVQASEEERGPAGLVDAYIRYMNTLPPVFFTHLIPAVAAGQAAFQPLLRLAEKYEQGPELGMAISRGVRHNVTTEMDLALWDAAQTIAADEPSARHFQDHPAQDLARQCLEGSLPPAAQAAMQCFLVKYGMRGLGEIDLGRERWREDPSPLVQTVCSYLNFQDEERSPRAVMARGAEISMDAENRLAQRVRTTRGGWVKERYVRWASNRVRELTGLRESPKFMAIRVMGAWRRAFLAAGNRLAQDGVLGRSGDIFFLHLDEIKALGEGKKGGWRELVAERRAVYDRELRRRQVPRLMFSDGTAFFDRSIAHGGEDEHVLPGSAVSPGVIEGTARVMHDPRGARLVPGEILVCPATDPSWTPLFLSAGGLVMEVGGMMTHGSVVAREYGIPAVVGVSYATSRIQTGQRIRVDGTQGTVEIL